MFVWMVVVLNSDAFGRGSVSLDDYEFYLFDLHSREKYSENQNQNRNVERK